MSENFKYDICIIGGFGHVGLPLGIVFADKGQKVLLYDIDVKKAETINKGILPFVEYGAEEILKKTVENGTLQTTSDRAKLKEAKSIILAIGTPVDEYLNPKTRQFLEVIKSLKADLRSDQLIIIRSTVFPHTSEQVRDILGPDFKVAYCPERIVQGYSVKELNELPQVIAGLTKEAETEAAKLFGILSPKLIITNIGEAEMVKLFSNAWRYIQFATTNQFYMICENFGIDYNKVRQAMVEGYGRNANLPSAGFAAGPCLLKDTMQLASFSGNNFMLGHSAMLINEGLPNFITDQLRKRHQLKNKKIGILGMAFKADIDDIRDSLSYKLGKILRFHGAEVMYSDEFAKDPTFISAEEMLTKAEIIIIGVPHTKYKSLKFPEKTELVDLWGIK